MTNYITATFRTRDELKNALLGLESIGVKEDQITIIAKEDTHKGYAELHEDVDIEKSTSEAATTGSLIGALLGGVVAATAFVLPGVNVIVGGALAATLLGAGAGAMTGAVAGGLLGALGAYGVSEADAKVYEEEIKSGSTLIMVQPTSNVQHREITEVLGRENAYRLAA